MIFVKRVLFFVKNDLQDWRRSPTGLMGSFFFSFLFVLLLSLSLGFSPRLQVGGFFSVIWLSILFASSTTLARLFEAESRRDMIEAMRFIPATLIPLFIAKVLSHWFFLCLLGLCSTLFSVLFFNGTPKWSDLFLIVPFLLGTLGISILGALFSGLLVHEKKLEVVLPLIIYPLLLPLMIGVMQVGLKVLADESARDWILFLVSFDLLYGVGALMIWDFVFQIKSGDMHE